MAIAIAIRPAAEFDLPALLALCAELHPDDPALPLPAALRTWQAIQEQAGRTILPSPPAYLSARPTARRCRT